MSDVLVGVPTTSYPRFEGDPAGSFVRDLCVALVARGHRCEVLAPADEDATGGPVDEGIRVHRVAHRPAGWPRTFYGAGAPDNLRDLRAWAGALAYPACLAAEVRRRGRSWDAVLSHWGMPSAASVWSVRGAQGHVAVWHSGDVHLTRRLGGARCWAGVAPWAARHVFVAAHLRARMPGAAGDPRAVVLPMGVTLPAAPAPREPMQGRRLRALVLARLVPIKRIDVAIEAVLACHDVELIVAGGGPERSRLERLARGSDRVRFVGEVGEADKRALLDRADVFLATSGRTRDGATEGLPVAPREALVHGAAVLATDDPVHRELAARAGSGVTLVGVPTVESLARALGRFVRDPAELERARPRPGCLAEDAWPTLAARFETLLLEASGR
ncbi:MAG: glycosyltransferase family 4 protein [Sandaracinaceae bacterium]